MVVNEVVKPFIYPESPKGIASERSYDFVVVDAIIHSVPSIKLLCKALFYDSRLFAVQSKGCFLVDLRFEKPFAINRSLFRKKFYSLPRPVVQKTRVIHEQ